MDPWTYSLNLARLGFEAQCVIALRMMRLAGGGTRARREAGRMIAEKSAALIAAQIGAGVALAGGRGPRTAAVRALRPYKRAVSRNRRRLSRRQ